MATTGCQEWGIAVTIQSGMISLKGDPGSMDQWPTPVHNPYIRFEACSIELHVHACTGVHAQDQQSYRA